MQRIAKSARPLKSGVIAKILKGLSREQSAALFVGGMTALQILLRGDIKRGGILIYGASGSVGTYALKIVAALGSQVPGVCSTANMELVRSLLERPTLFQLVFDDMINFFDLGEKVVIAKALARAAQKGTIRRLVQGFISSSASPRIST